MSSESFIIQMSLKLPCDVSYRAVRSARAFRLFVCVPGSTMRIFFFFSAGRAVVQIFTHAGDIFTGPEAKGIYIYFLFL